MLDSSTKLQAGLLAGNMADFGHYDECLSVDSGDFYGQHCLIYIPLAIASQMTGIDTRGLFNSSRDMWKHELTR